MSGLKPCPFCGKEAQLIQCDVCEWFVKCKYAYCGVEQGFLYKSKQAAIKSWNRRAYEQQENRDTV